MQIKLLKVIKLVKNNLTDDLRRSQYKGSKNYLAEHCYIACEAIFHLTNKILHLYFIRHENNPHWFLRNSDGLVIDPTANQFNTKINYNDGIGKGFLTSSPSKRCKILINRIQNEA